MNRKRFFSLVAVGMLAASLVSNPGWARDRAVPRPNYVVFFCDDLGYADIGCFGSLRNKTPNIDRLAREGMRFTDFYVTAPVCSPSRASLMTGCYPLRVDMARSSVRPYVLLPADKKGLNPEETTIAEILKAEGYATACIGKWHLGDQPEFLPTRQGFDTFYGIPFSNDMKRKGPRKGETENRGVHLPPLKIDGKDISALIKATGVKTPDHVFFYYRIDQLRAVRSGKWKLHLACDPLLEGWRGEDQGNTCEMALYDLESDIAEKHDVADGHPDVVKRLLGYATDARRELGDWDRKGEGTRKSGWVEDPVHPSHHAKPKPTQWDGNPDAPRHGGLQ